LEDFDIGYFYTDVAVEASRDEAGDDVHDVGCCLPVVRGETLHDGVEGVLALITVDENAEEEVHDVDEDVGAEDPFPEVPGVSHLGEEGDEEHGSSVGIDGLVETVQGLQQISKMFLCGEESSGESREHVPFSQPMKWGAQGTG